jgi:hypothetical protein
MNKAPVGTCREGIRPMTAAARPRGPRPVSWHAASGRQPAFFLMLVGRFLARLTDPPAVTR